MRSSDPRSSWARAARARLAVGTAVLVLALLSFPAAAPAATAGVNLGTADAFAVLAGAGITNTGDTTITGDVGSFPTTTQTGFGSVTLHGTNHGGNAVTQQAKNDLDTAYVDAANRDTTEQIATDLVGQVLVPGVYDSASGTFGNSGTLTLDGQNLENPVFIFKMASTLITGSGSTVVLQNGATACNVYWQVGSSATLGTNSELTGTIMALTSITLETGATLEGRALARNGAVTMDTNQITRTACSEPVATTTTIDSSAAETDPGEPVTLTATVVGDDGSTPTGSVAFHDGDLLLDTVSLDGGTATLTTVLTSGTHSLTATYLGAPGFGASSSEGLTQTVVTPTPLEPAVPTEPVAPVEPVAPASPAAPATPATPVVPVAPAAPAAPVGPAAPGVPRSPVAPVTPAVPQLTG